MTSRANVSAPRSYLFTVRVWPEELAEDQREWRGKVQHINSGEAFYFRKWSELTAHMIAWLELDDPPASALE